MAILFLDPLVLTAYGVLGVGVWWVWTGRFQAWFAHGRMWGAVVWPFPLVTGLLPLVAGALSGLLGQLGAEGGAGTLAGAAYLAAYVVPWAWLSIAPPRWLLPGWARARIQRPPRRRDAPSPDAVPALNAWRGRGHATRARWVWAVDAQPGFLWVDDGVLRFRASTERTDGHEGQTARGMADDLDDDVLATLELSASGEPRLESPRGGWWSQRVLDVDLAAVDGWRIDDTRPGSRAGLLTVEVQGRRSLRVWVTDAGAIRNAIVAAGPGVIA